MHLPEPALIPVSIPALIASPSSAMHLPEPALVPGSIPALIASPSSAMPALVPGSIPGMIASPAMHLLANLQTGPASSAMTASSPDWQTSRANSAVSIVGLDNFEPKRLWIKNVYIYVYP